MKTVIFRYPNDEEINKIGLLLKEGQLIAIPTETVYGLGANGLDERAMEGIYEAKGRPSDNPLILHVADQSMVDSLVKVVTPTAKKLMDAFWPGPLTITLEKSTLVPHKATGGLNRVALRCPKNDLCRSIIKASGVPIAAPSANISGRPSPTSAEEVFHDMNGKIYGIVDGGPCPVGIESTVVEVGTDEVTILRPGAITEELLLTVVSKVHWDPALVEGTEVPKAPGMKYTHYAPNAPMTTYVGLPKALADQFALTLKEVPQDAKIGIFISEETHRAIVEAGLLKDDIASRIELIIYGKQSHIESLGQSLYKSLLVFNERAVDLIWAEGTDRDGFGKAIMNRMDKASSHRIIVL